MKIKQYFELFKFPRMIFFIEVIIGYFIASNFKFNNILIWGFISLSLLVYPGIYMLNDILDKKEDCKDSKKKLRPIASGIISVKEGFAFLIVVMALGLILGYLIDVRLFAMNLVFILFNLVYSIYLKHIPYIEFISNGITHALRFYLGIILSGSYNYLLLTISILLLSGGFSALKRENEILNKRLSRKTLKSYSLNKLYIIYLIIFILLNFILVYNNAFKIIILLEILIFVLIILLYHSSSLLQSKMDSYLRF